MKNVNKTQKGFILPTVVAVSLATITVIVALLVLTSSSYKAGPLDSYQKLADEAAEAGTAYATACLTLSAHSQTWGPAAGKSNLSSNTDCSGVNSFSSNNYVYSDSNMRSYFSVGDLDYSYQFSAQVSAQGYTDVLNGSGTVVKTYSSIKKKVIVWPTDVNVSMSASGTNRTCAIVNAQVYCWGYNAYGQLGDGRYIGSPADPESSSSIDSTIPVKVRQDTGVLAGKTIVKIFVAQYHTCALSSDGLMYCWGYNYKGELGQGNTTDSPVAIQVGGALAGKTITDIGGTDDASCAIASGKIYCWGGNNYGVTGLGVTSSYTTSPTLVTASNTATTLPTAYTATSLSTSGSRSPTMCAVLSTGKAYCWGSNYAGSVGDGTSGSPNQYRTVPTKVIDTGVLSGKTVTTLSQDGYPAGGVAYPHVCALASGSVYCWGANANGQLGNNSTTDSSVPVAVTASGVLNGKTITDVKVGLYHSCALASGGDYCWGYNSSGQVGDGTNTSRQVPVAVFQQSGKLTASNVVSIGAGSNRGCAVINDGRTFCWGLNGSGQIGDGTTISRNVPTESLFLRPTGNQYIF